MNVENIADGTVRLTVEALDEDGMELLTYAFDFDDDGIRGQSCRQINGASPLP